MKDLHVPCCYNTTYGIDFLMSTSSPSGIVSLGFSQLYIRRRQLDPTHTHTLSLPTNQQKPPKVSFPANSYTLDCLSDPRRSSSCTTHNRTATDNYLPVGYAHVHVSLIQYQSFQACIRNTHTDIFRLNPQYTK